MSTLYRLHYAPDNASLIVRLVLEELGASYETVLVDRRVSEHRSEAYRAINPAAKIPAIETPEGIIFETAAIVLWLSEKHGAMAPSTGAADRGDFLKWLFYVSNTLHMNLRLLFYPKQFTGQVQDALRLGAQANLTECLNLLNTEAARGHQWLNNESPSVVDYYLCAALRWMGIYPAGFTNWFALSDWPHLEAMAQRLEKRPAALAAVNAEGLGENPFSNPQYCTPVEGSAL